MSKRFVQDDDGHWYLIPADEEHSFEQWVYAMEDGIDWPGKDFEDYRCDHPSRYVVEAKE